MINKSLVGALICLFLSACGGGSSSQDIVTDVEDHTCDLNSPGSDTDSECFPDNEAIPEKCPQAQELGIVISVPEPKYQTTVDGDEYELYFRQVIEVMEPATGLTEENAAAKTFLDAQIENFLSYKTSSGIVTGATNPLDFLEAIIATTDPGQEIEAFKIAKEQVANSISHDEEFCRYTYDVRLVDTNTAEDTLAFAEVSISYDPLSRVVQQTTLVTTSQEDLNTSEARFNIPYIGFNQVLPENFKAIGYSEPKIRKAIINNDSGFATLAFDEGEDTKLGQILLEYSNDYCDDTRDTNNPADWDECPTGTVTRVPSTQVGGVCDNEANKLRENSFDLNVSNTGLKRLRVEVDFIDAVGQVRIYASSYNEAIYASDGSTVIEDPTTCEKRAVLDELAGLTPDVEVQLTLVPDTGYDIEYQLDADGNPEIDANGNQVVLNEPIPIVTYQGTASAIQH